MFGPGVLFDWMEIRMALLDVLKQVAQTCCPKLVHRVRCGVDGDENGAAVGAVRNC